MFPHAARYHWLTDAARYHWLTEIARYWIKGSPLLSVPEIGLELPVGRGDIAIDCGANVGDITSMLARTGAHVYAFEPNPRCFEILAKRFRSFTNVDCVNAGVMDRPGKLTLRVPQAHAHYSTIQASHAGSFESDALALGHYSITETVVDCIDLAQFILSLGRRIRFVKLDVEGSEIQIIDKMIDTNAIEACDLVEVETHERLSPRLHKETVHLRERIHREGLDEKIRLDWI